MAADETILVANGASHDEDQTTAEGRRSGEVAAADGPRLAFCSPGDRIGRYEIIKQLGAGGMAVVYEALDPQLGRRVALKVLHRRLAVREGGRLVREAQSMAQLSHPNVVTVYEVGVVDGEIFVCMELVPGMTLRAWLAAATRSRRDVLDMFIAAGRGLEAAHEARIVHRDFKPDNVLIDDHGRARVTDFGLAREMGDVGAPEASSPETRATSTESLRTETGALMGTPLYMAPELLRSGSADARSDQYAFCVALYEAVYGAVPYSGRTLAELAGRVDSGRFDPTPAGRKVPRWLRAVLLRGLDRDPASRFPSMSDLLAELARDHNVVARRISRGALALVAGGVGAALWMQQRGASEPTCADPAGKLAGIWDDARRSAVEQAFRKTQLPHAASSFTAAVTLIDAYVASWKGMDRESCEASLIRGEQRRDLYDLRSLCLERRKAELAAAVSLLEQADAQVVQRADDVVRSLEPVLQCANAAALSQVMAVPEDPAAAAAIERIEANLSAASLQLQVGHLERSSELVASALAEADKVNYAPIEAQAHLVKGMVEAKRGDLAAAERELLEAAAHAEEGRDDRRKVRAFTELIYLVGYEREDFRRGETYVPLAEAALERAGGDRELRGRLLSSAGAVAFLRGDYQLAYERNLEAVRVLESLYGPSHPDVAIALGRRAVILVELGKIDEALAIHARALDIWRDTYGENHPDYAVALNDRASALARAGRLSEAEADFQTSLGVMEAAFGRKHPETATAMANLATILHLRGDHEAALHRLRTVVAIEEEVLGEEHTGLASTLLNVGAVAASLGRVDEALEALHRALAIRKHNLPAEDTRIGEAEVALGVLLVDTGRLADGLVLLERVVQRGDARGTMTAELPEARFALARALWGLGRDRVRARDLATAARDQFVTLGDEATAEAVAAWLAERQ